MDFMKCRLCLDNINNSNMVDIFQTTDKNNIALNEKVEYCCGIKIYKDNEITSNICQKCCDILDIAFNFRKMCRNSQKYFCSFIMNSKCPTKSDDTPNQDKESNSYEIGAKIEQSDYEPEHNECNNDNTGVDDTEFIDYANFPNEESVNDCIDISDEDKDINRPRRRKRKYEYEFGSFMCYICGQIFTKKTAFNYHMIQHREPNLECEICSRKFRQTCELKYHMRVHTGEKPYSCSHCSRRFIDLGGKIRHERTHTNERPYKCISCDRRFLYSWSLKKHELIHSGVKPHICNTCDKSFTLLHQLKAHLETTLHKQNEAQLEKDVLHFKLKDEAISFK